MYPKKQSGTVLWPSVYLLLKQQLLIELDESIFI